jgi:hypothetical protein
VSGNYQQACGHLPQNVDRANNIGVVPQGSAWHRRGRAPNYTFVVRRESAAVCTTGRRQGGGARTPARRPQRDLGVATPCSIVSPAPPGSSQPGQRTAEPAGRPAAWGRRHRAVSSRTQRHTARQPWHIGQPTGQRPMRVTAAVTVRLASTCPNGAGTTRGACSRSATVPLTDTRARWRGPRPATAGPPGWAPCPGRG